MTGASTKREDVERQATDLCDPCATMVSRIHAAATLRALLDERDRLARMHATAFDAAVDAQAERDAARAECEAHKARADRYDTEAACASILRAEVKRMREALSVAEKRLDSGAVRLAELGDARAAYGLKDWAAEARAALAGAPRHD
jgi:predicted  nucleic acid-binding Zn-ribbon protein